MGGFKIFTFIREFISDISKMDIVITSTPNIKPQRTMVFAI